MSEIPEDVMKIAWAVEHQIAASMIENRYSMTDTAEMIARAILAERNREHRVFVAAPYYGEFEGHGEPIGVWENREDAAKFLLAEYGRDTDIQEFIIQRNP